MHVTRRRSSASFHDFRGCLPALLGSLVLACAHDSDPRPAEPAGVRALATAGFRWRIIELPQQGLRLHLHRHSAPDDDARVVVDSVRHAQADVLALLEEPMGGPARPTGRADGADEAAVLFFLGSRGDMRRLTGRPLAGFVQPGEATAFFVWADGFRAPLRHELAHLYTLERWGRPAAAEAATWLVEGIAAWAGGPCQGASPDALAAGLLARGVLPSVAELAGQFRALPENVGMPAVGSLTQFLYAREGIAGLRARWNSPTAEALPDSATEAAWRTHVASVRPATLDVGRVMQEGC